MMDTKELKRLAEQLVGRKWPNFSEAFDMVGSSWEAALIRVASPDTILALIAADEAKAARIAELEAAAGAPDLRSEIPTWNTRMVEHYSKDGVTALPNAHFMYAEIADLRAALESAAPVAAAPLTPFEIVGIAKAEGLKMRTGQGAIRFARAIQARIMGGAK